MQYIIYYIYILNSVLYIHNMQWIYILYKKHKFCNMAHLLNLFICIVYSVFLFGPSVVVKRVLWNRICPSFSTSFHLFGCFLGIVSLVFSKFWHVSRNLNEVMRDRARFSGEINFCPKNWGNGPKMSQKQVILDLLKNWSLIFTEFLL